MCDRRDVGILSEVLSADPGADPVGVRRGAPRVGLAEAVLDMWDDLLVRAAELVRLPLRRGVRRRIGAGAIGNPRAKSRSCGWWALREG